MKILVALTWLALLSPHQLTYAFTPRAAHILKKAADSHPKGPLQIERTSHFRTATDSLALRESWIVDGEQSIKVTVRSAHQVVYQALFIDGSKHEYGKPSRPISSDFFETHFLYRTPRKWLDWLFRENFVGKETLESRPIKDLKTYVWQGDDSVQLSRAAGRITFRLSHPRQAGAAIWFDQADYSPLKIRSPQGAEYLVVQNMSAPKSALFPKEAILTWGPYSVNIQTHNIDSIKSVGKNFDPSLLARSRWDVLPESASKALALQFYERFR